MDSSNPKVHVFIYCRAASATPTNPFDAVLEQEVRCRVHANNCGLHVTDIFCDIGFKDSRQRPMWTKMLAALRETGGGNVIVDDVRRLGRRVETVVAMRTELQAAGANLTVPSSSPLHARSGSLSIDHPAASMIEPSVTETPKRHRETPVPARGRTVNR